jgi:serine/threonine protein kinase
LCQEHEISKGASMPSVMICYGSDTRAFVDKLAEALEAKQITVWYYDKHQTLGIDFGLEVQRQLIISSAVLVVWSKAACQSIWVRAEADRARKHSKLLQIRWDQCDLPIPFDRYTYADFSPGEWTNQHVALIDRIVDSVRKSTETHSGQQNAADTNIDSFRNVLEKEIRVDILKFIGTGEISNVYLGRHGTRLVSVKAANNLCLSPMGKAELSKEIELASYLVHPAFLRIFLFHFHDNKCFIVSDYADGETIAKKLVSSNTFSLKQTINILRQLCGTVVEAHERGLKHLRLIPSEIYVDIDQSSERQVVHLSPVNMALFLERIHANDTLMWKEESTPFMAPELFRSTINQCIDKDLEAEAAKQEMIQKANQFALGMLAWVMLEGKLPIPDSKGRTPYDRIGEFLRASNKFPDHVRFARWRSEGRALARVIARMVSPDPKKRWNNLRQVGELIGAIAADYDADGLENVVKGVYRRISDPKTTFYRRFYEALFDRAPHLKIKFNRLDMKRQNKMLEVALGQVLNYTQQQDEPTTLTQLIEPHRKLDLTTDDFIIFGETLIETFNSSMPKSRERERIMAALEIIVWPAIEYLMQKCTTPNKTDMEH